MRRGTLAAVGSLGCLLGLVVFGGLVVTDEPTLGLVLAEVGGTVTVTETSRQVVPAVSGEILRANEYVTTGTGGRAVLAMGSETRVRLGPSSSVQILHVDDEGVALELEEGALQATVRPDGGSLRLSSLGREALMTDADVQAGLAPTGVLQLEATRGDVMLGGVVGIDSISEGERLTVDPSAHGALGPIPDELLLKVSWPEKRRTRSDRTWIRGLTEPGARVLVSGSYGTVVVRADESGRFEAEIELEEGSNPVRVHAQGILGEQVGVTDVVERDVRGPTFHGGVEYGR